MMRAKRFLAFLLALAMIMSLVPGTTFAADLTYQLVAANAVEVDGTEDKTIDVFFQSINAEETFSLEATWSTSEVGDSNYLTLTELTPNGVTPMNNSVSTGKVYWTDGSFVSPIITSAGGTIWTATYTVDKNTPVGTYTVSLTGKTTDSSFGDNEFGTLTATIEVKAPSAKYEIWYELGGNTYEWPTDVTPDTDNFEEYEAKDTVEATVYMQNNTASDLTMQAYDIYLTYSDKLVFAGLEDMAGTAYKADGVEAAAGEAVTHIQLVKDNNKTITLAKNTKVPLGKIKFTFADGAVYEEQLPIAITIGEEGKTVTNFALAKDEKSYYPKNAGTLEGAEIMSTYTVTYNANGGENAPGAQTKEHGNDLVLTTVEPTFTGHKFLGWTTVENPALNAAVEYAAGATYKANADATLYAVWQKNTFTVEWHNADGEVIETDNDVAYGTTAEFNGEKPSKTEEGYTFTHIGWNTTQNAAEALDKLVVTENTTYYPVFKKTVNQYTITFENTGDTTIAPQTKDFGAQLDPVADPQKTGYTFTGWDPEIPKTMPAKDMTVKAQWSPITYTVKYNSNTGEGSTTTEGTFTYDADGNLAANTFAKPGYTFAGWNTQADGNGTSYAETASIKNLTSDPTKPVELYAQWTKNTYTVKFDANGGSGTMADQSFTYDEEQALNANAFTAPEGSVFAGWTEIPGSTTAQYNDKAAVKNLTQTAGGVVTLYAVWKQDVYQITYTSDPTGIDMKTEGLDGTYSSEAGYVITVEPTATGYTFKEWTTTTAGVVISNDGKTVTIQKGQTGPVELTALFTINQYTITVNTDGGNEIAPIKQDYNTAVTKPADPTKEGYTFKGWDVAFPDKMPAQNMEITAQWTINQYTITFDTDGGTPTIPAITQDFNTAVTAPDTTNLTKEGYTFTGWSPDVPATMPAEDVKVKAQWREHTYDVTYDREDGVTYDPTVKDLTDVEYTEEITLPTTDKVTKPGYTLEGWTTDPNNGTVYEPGKVVNKLTPDDNGSVTLYPVWKEAEYEVSFDLGAHPADDATIPEAIKVIYSKEYPELPEVVPAKGYTFVGWYTDVDDEDAQIVMGDTVEITADTVLTAKYTIIEYKITFDANGGTDIPDATYTVETDYVLPEATGNGLYKFVKWEVVSGTDDWELDPDATEKVTVNAGSIHETGHLGNVDLVAIWTIPFTYEVESYAYALSDYVMLRIATADNTDCYTFNGQKMFYTDNENYYLNVDGEGENVFVTLIPTKIDGKVLVNGATLTEDGMKLIGQNIGESAVVISHTSGDINDDGVVNVADANVVYQMVIGGGSYYTENQVDTLHRLMADMDTTRGNDAFRGSVEDVNEIIEIINK